MNKKTQVRIVGVLLVAALIFGVVMMLRKRKAKSEPKPGKIEPSKKYPEGIGCDSPSALEAVFEIDYNDPAENIGACGEAVASFQDQLNRLGQSIATDGIYGPVTQSAHQNILDSNFGSWPIK